PGWRPGRRPHTSLAEGPVLVLLLAQWLWTVPGGGVARRGQPVGPQWMGKGLPTRSVGSVRAVDGAGGVGCAVQATGPELSVSLCC
uniref:Uncharacterized protein n=1 Tax=Neovison vison TaxID=452646 RepID=A0A8C7BXV6_NEOVI